MTDLTSTNSPTEPHREPLDLAAIRAEAASLTEGFVLDRVPALLSRAVRVVRDALTTAEAERDEARAALAALREQYRDLATYRTTHANLGLCPEGPDDPARDPDCPVCAAVSAAAPDEREALDVKRLRAFAEAVLALHRRNRPEDGGCQGWTPEGYGDLDAWCVECSAQSGREYGTPWPCRTAALAEHLGGEAPSTDGDQ